MRKNFRNVAALLLSLVILCMSLVSCGGEVTKKVTVEVAIYSLDAGSDSLWARVKELEIEEGKTAYDAVVALCTERGIAYTENSDKMFETFTNEELGPITIPATETVDEKNIKYYHFGWKLNDEIQSSLDNNKKMIDYVLVNGDTIAVFIQADVVSSN